MPIKRIPSEGGTGSLSERRIGNLDGSRIG
jgi:hypothetical protein